MTVQDWSKSNFRNRKRLRVDKLYMQADLKLNAVDFLGSEKHTAAYLVHMSFSFSPQASYDKTREMLSVEEDEEKPGMSILRSLANGFLSCMSRFMIHVEDQAERHAIQIHVGFPRRLKSLRIELHVFV